MGDASPADGFAGGGGGDTVHGTGPLVPSVEWVVLAVGFGEIAAKGIETPAFTFYLCIFSQLAHIESGSI